MARLPTVAIIGRPNTGKSTLFNRIVGRRKAIVSDIPGTTRDHIASKIDGEDVDYLLVDTGGMGGGTEDEDFEDDVHMQSLLALENGDLILLTLNSKEDLTASDYEIIDILRKNKKAHVPIILVLTKCDNPEQNETILPQYYELKCGDDIVPISAPHNLGMDELTELVEKKLKELHFEKEEKNENTDIPRIAIIGKPNVGKSSIVNALMSDQQRSTNPLLVSDTAGTTRDSTDTLVKYHEKEYLFIDTAGIKRRSQTAKDIETFSYFRSVRSLQEADIAVLVLDTSSELSKQDKRIARMAIEEGKGLILLLNKIDLLETEDKSAYKNHIDAELQFCKFAVTLPCSAHTREGLLKLFETIEVTHANRQRRIQTKALNDWYRRAISNQPMRAIASGKYITQAEDSPPTFVLFVKQPKKVNVSQLRFLENRLRETFSFEGTPVRWITKSSSSTD